VDNGEVKLVSNHPTPRVKPGWVLIKPILVGICKTDLELSCNLCKKGLQKHCPNRSVLGIYNADGAFAEYFTMPKENIHILPEGVSDEQAVFVEPLAASLEILMQTHIKPTWRVMVLGDGKLGLLVTQVLRLTGCDLVLVGKHENKLRIAERMGVKTATLENPGHLRLL